MYIYQKVEQLRREGLTWQQVANRLGMPKPQCMNNFNNAQRRGKLHKDCVMSRPKVIRQ